jgi:hypothetical protein
LYILDFALRGSLTFTEACVNVRNDVDQSQLISDDFYQYFACKFNATTIVGTQDEEKQSNNNNNNNNNKIPQTTNIENYKDEQQYE